MSFRSVNHNETSVKYVYALSLNGKVTWYESLSQVIRAYSDLPFHEGHKCDPVEFAEVLLENGIFKCYSFKKGQLVNTVIVSYAMTNGSF